VRAAIQGHDDTSRASVYDDPLAQENASYGSLVAQVLHPSDREP
jgi:hypothetical protein